MPAAASAAGFIILFSSLSPVNASDTWYPPIVQKLSEKFNLNEDEVKAVFDDDRAEHRADMTAQWEEKLSQAVKDGKISEEQRQAIIDKRNEMDLALEDLKNLSPEDRKQRAKELFDDLKSWVKDNNINVSTIGQFGMGHGFGRGFKMGYHMGIAN